MHDDNDTQAGSPDNPWADRVNEAYYDKMGEGFGRQTRDRINWMCAQARGETVLDVGCSQGISSILLAREGMRVVGLDIYPPAIEYANGERRKEIESVVPRLEFRCAELAAVSGELFDTVIMGEVIEHQTNPARFVEQASKLVSANGRLVITVPYGLHPWPDHKSTIFPRQLYTSIAESFRITLLEVTNGYIRMVLDRRESPRLTDSESDRLLEVTENGAVESQSKYYEANAKAQALSKNAFELQASIGRIQAEHSEQSRKQFDTLAGHASRIEELQKQAEVHKTLSQESSHSIIEMERVKQHLVSEHKSLEIEHQSTLDLNVKLTSERKDLEIELQSAVDQNVKLTSERKDLEIELQSALDQKAMLLSSALESNENLEKSSQRHQELQQSIEALQLKLKSLEEQHAIAQQKRTGHYQHLEAERARSKKLIALAQDLHHENQLYRNSIALEMGRVLLSMRKPKELPRLPSSLARVWRGYRKRRKEGTVIEPLLLPRLDAARLEQGKGIASSWSSSGDGKNGHKSLPLLSEADANDARKHLSALGWVQEVRTSALPVASVLDEFSRSCFSPHASLIEPRPDNWEALLEKYSPRLLLVESSWKGNYGTWQYRVANYANPPGRELTEMVEGFRARGIPTVFWNKEDPVHFNNFIEAASQFDIVLTTAAEAVSMYREKTSARAQVLQFAAEESLHNPIGSARRNGKVCFAGSFYANRFHERRDDQLMLLDAASECDFDIYDRNHDPRATAKSDFAFPDRFSQFVKGSLPYDAMGRAYREYRVFLNVNSIIDSPTMFSRRVFELLACGTPVVSTWSRGTEETFGDNLVWHVRNKDEAAEALGVLMTDDREWRRRSLAGIRAVFSEHTFRHRFHQILDIAGLRDDSRDAFERVLVVAEIANQFEADAVVASFARQRMSTGTSKECLLVMRGSVPLSMLEAGVKVVHDTSASVAVLLERRKPLAGNRIIASMSPLAVYGAHYLQDLLHAARYSKAVVVGKPADSSEFSQYQYDIPLDPRTLLVNEALLRDKGVTLDDVLSGDVLGRTLGLTGKVYAADTANYLVVNTVMDAAGQAKALVGIEL